MAGHIQRHRAALQWPTAHVPRCLSREHPAQQPDQARRGVCPGPGCTPAGERTPALDAAPNAATALRGSEAAVLQLPGVVRPDLAVLPDVPDLARPDLAAPVAGPGLAACNLGARPDLAGGDVEHADLAAAQNAR